jgi:CheY-like chemotaxis protein
MGQNSRTILLVDDNRVVRSVVSAAFEGCGYTVREAANGLEAVEAVKLSMPDVILLDLAMPVMNGWEAAPRLRELAPKAVILLFTLHEISNEIAATRGVDLVVSKTHNLGALLDVVNEQSARQASPLA